MKLTRKQKLRKREERRHRFEDRKFALVERVLDLLDARDLLLPLFAADKADILELIGPKIEVVLAGCTKESLILNDVCHALEAVIEQPVLLSVDGRDVVLSYSDFLRGYVPLTGFIGSLYDEVRRYKPAARNVLTKRIADSAKKIEEFERDHLNSAYDLLAGQLVEITDSYFRIDESVMWSRLDRKQDCTDRLSLEIVVGQKKPLPVSLPVADGRRKAYACERAVGGYDLLSCMTRQRMHGWESARRRPGRSPSISARMRSAGCTSACRLLHFFPSSTA